MAQADSLRGSDHWAHFGDGESAQILNVRDTERRQTGHKMFRFVLLPSQRMVEIYNLKNEQDENGFIMKEFNHSDVKFLERGVNRTRCWVLRDVNDGPCAISRWHQDLRDTIKDDERVIRSLEAGKNRAYYDLDMERKQQTQAIRTQVDKLLEVARGRKRMDHTEETDMSGTGEG